MFQTNGFHDNSEMEKKFEEITIEVPWGHIAGKWWGPKNVQPILAIHGWQDNACTFDTLAPLLISPDVSILCIDLPGHGFSSHYPNGQYYYLFWDGVLHVRRVVRHFKWDKISIMGHSLGGGIGFLYSAIYPDEVDKYISLDIACPSIRDLTDKLGETIDRFFKYETLKPHENPMYSYNEMIDITEIGHKNNLTRKSCEILMRRGMKPVRDDSSVYTFCRDPRLKCSALAMFTLEQVYSFAIRIKCRVLNIRASVALYDQDYYDSVIEKIKTNASVDYHRVNGNHHVHLNNPERISGIIAEFLNS